MLESRRVYIAIGIERIGKHRFQWFVVRGQRTIFQSAADVNPTYAVRVHNERLVSAKGGIPFRSRFGLVIRRFVFCEIRCIQSCPLFFVLIPPNQFLALTPWFAIRPCRGPVVNNAPVRWPGIAPAMSIQTMWLTHVCFVLIFIWETTGVDPCATRSRPVSL